MDHSERPDPPSIPIDSVSTPEQWSLAILEFPEVIDRLTAYTRTSIGAEASATLEPTGNPQTVTQRQMETEEAKRLIMQNHGLEFNSTNDLRGIVQRAQREGLLTGSDLREIIISLDDGRRIRTALGSTHSFPILRRLANQIPSTEKLSSKLKASTNDSGSIADEASITLQMIRRETRSAYDKLEQALHGLIRSPQGRRTLQEPLVTERNGRMVLPVKTNMKGDFPGVVHDVSESGATTFIEPLEIVPLCNLWREGQLSESREIDRILVELTAAVSAHRHEILLTLDILGQLDLAMAKGELAIEMHGNDTHSTTVATSDFRLIKARHPLLAEPATPITMDLGNQNLPQAAGSDQQTSYVILITGPNAGGKTLALKTFGLLSLMNQSGLQIPVAPGSTLPIFDGVYADIGDEQSIHKSLSTFTAHIKHIRNVFSVATSASLILLDELGSSTDPEQGSALAKAILNHLLDMKSLTFCTTHQRELAGFVDQANGMTNASVGIDPTTLIPKYDITLGLPGESYTLKIAEESGIPNQIIREAEVFLAPSHKQLDHLLNRLRLEAETMTNIRIEQESLLEESKKTTRGKILEAEEIHDRREREKEEWSKRITAQAKHLLKELKSAERTLKPKLVGHDQLEGIRSATKSVKAIQEQLKGPDWKTKTEPTPLMKINLTAGAIVHAKGFSEALTVIRKPTKQGFVDVALGAIRLKIPLTDVLRFHHTTGIDPDRSIGRSLPKTNVPDNKTIQLDLRGQRAQVGIERMDVFLDQALRNGAKTVIVIHGSGTGALRTAIREHLISHPGINTWTPGNGSKAEEVTIINLT